MFFFKTYIKKYMLKEKHQLRWDFSFSLINKRQDFLVFNIKKSQADVIIKTFPVII